MTHKKCWIYKFRQKHISTLTECEKCWLCQLDEHEFEFHLIENLKLDPHSFKPNDFKDILLAVFKKEGYRIKNED